MAVFNVLTDNVDSNKIFYLTIYLIIIFAGYFMNKVGDASFRGKVKVLSISEDMFKLAIIFMLIFFMTNFHEVFKGGKMSGVFIIVFAVFTITSSLVQPYFDRFVGDDKYIYFNFGDFDTMIMLGLVAFFSVGLYFVLLPNFGYESYMSKFLFILFSSITIIARSFFGKKDLALWVMPFLLLLGSPPQYTFMNSTIQTLLTSYLIHGVVNTDLDIYR